MTCGIYMIQNKVNGKIYIGQAVDIADRWGKHKANLRGNLKQPNKHLQNAWNYYGEDNFEFTIICECNENQLNTMEEYYIFELMTYDKDIGYNKTYGGDSGRPTEESRKKNSESHKGKYCGESNPFYGKHHSEESKRKNSESHKGKTLSEETKKKISVNHKGMYGKHHSEETKQEISKNMKGKYKGENAPLYGKFGFEHPASIPVVQLTLEGEFVKVYGSSMEAERNGFSNSTINLCCRGKRKAHKKYKWMYLSDYEAMKKEG